MKIKTPKGLVNQSDKTVFLCLAESIEQNGTKCLKLLKSERKKITEESVHETRVTIRKLEACFELLDSIGIHQKKINKEFLNIRKIHGPLRNVHAELESIKEFESRVKSKSFKEYLKKRKQKIEKKIMKELAHISLDEQLSEIKRIVEKIFEKNNFVKNKIAINDMIVQNKKIFKEFEKTKNAFSSKSLESIHAIRITAKRLRYQSEILKPVLSFDNIKLRQLKNVQDVFGKIQNNNVLQKSILKFIHKQPKKASGSILELQNCVAKEQKILLTRAERMKGISFGKLQN